jgi:transposase
MVRGEVDTATELAQSAAAQGIADVSSRTVRRVLHHEGLKTMHTFNKPQLTPEHKRKRLEFARAHRDWTVEKWKQVIFSDKTAIVARPSDAHKLRWVKQTKDLNPKLVVPTVQGGGASILTWGCISRYGFHDFVLLDGKVTGKDYIKVLQQYLLPVIQEYFPDRPYIFRQDNAAVHAAREVQEFFQDENLQVLDWPPHSPDLNIIEHVWHYLKEAMRKQPVARNKEELWTNACATLPYLWSVEMTQKIQALYKSLPSRMQAVIAAHGGHTSY